MAQINFNASAVDTSGQPTLLAEGWHPMRVKRVEVKQTKAGTGSYIQVLMEVMPPSAQAGAGHIERYNWANPNPAAVEIGHQQLAMLCEAVNKPFLADTDELVNLQFEAEVIQEAPQPGYGASNSIKRYRITGSAGPITPLAVPAPAPAQAAPSLVPGVPAQNPQNPVVAQQAPLPPQPAQVAQAAPAVATQAVQPAPAPAVQQAAVQTAPPAAAQQAAQPPAPAPQAQAAEQKEMPGWLTQQQQAAHAAAQDPVVPPAGPTDPEEDDIPF